MHGLLYDIFTKHILTAGIWLCTCSLSPIYTNTYIHKDPLKHTHKPHAVIAFIQGNNMEVMSSDASAVSKERGIAFILSNNLSCFSYSPLINQENS